MSQVKIVLLILRSHFWREWWRKPEGLEKTFLEGMMEKTRGPGENHKTWQVNLQTLGFAKIGFHPRQREVPQFLFTL